MCDIDRSCAIIEDNGLSAAFTIAHEIGHLLVDTYHIINKSLQMETYMKHGIYNNLGSTFHTMTRKNVQPTCRWRRQIST